MWGTEKQLEIHETIVTPKRDCLNQNHHWIIFLFQRKQKK